MSSGAPKGKPIYTPHLQNIFIFTHLIIFQVNTFIIENTYQARPQRLGIVVQATEIRMHNN